jgi:RecA/RadA recombinase
MSKKKQLEVVNEKSDNNTNNLKTLANQMKEYMNAQYREAVAYVPDEEQIAAVSVSKWLGMPEAFKKATGLPGLPLGNITHVYGKPNCGKTSMLMEGIVQAQKQNILPILILTEHKFSFERLSKFMGADPEAMLVFHAGNLEQAYSFMEKILRDLDNGKLIIESPDGKDIIIDVTEQDCFIFMDSLGNTMSEAELDYDVEDHNKSMGKGAKAIKTLTRRINQLLERVRQRCGILLLNQSYMSMPSYGPSIETPYGGDGVVYSCILNIRLRRIRDLKMTIKGVETVIGLETKVQVMKNHITHKMPISSVYTVASGFIPAEKAALDDFKKKHMK